VEKKEKQIWTVVQVSEDQTFPWSGIYGSEEEAKEAVVDYIQHWIEEDGELEFSREYEADGNPIRVYEDSNGDTYLLVRHV